MKKESKQIAKQWVTIADASRFLGVSRDTLRRWEKKGTLISRRTVGGHRRYSRKQLERALRQPMSSTLDKTTTYDKQVSQISIPPQTVTIRKDSKSPTKINNLYYKISKYTKSWVFLLVIGILVVALLTASYILLQITKSQSQSELLSPVPSYRTLILP